MKRILMIWITISAILLSTKMANAGDYICLDPGHGGSDPGACGPVYQLPEQWVNLQVALKCSIFLDEMGQFYNIIMTRRDETTDVPLWDRVNKANYEGLYGGPVDAFVSIHHNSYPPYPGSQGTEVWWSSIPQTDSIYDRAYTDSTLGMKTQFRILNKWGYKDRCAYARAPIGTPTCNGEYCCNHCCVRQGSYPDYTWHCCHDPDFPDNLKKKLYFVLRNTRSPAALSEASNLKDTLEEFLFDWNDVHISEEAEAISDAIFSYLTNEGIAIVRNSYSGGTGGEVIVSKYSDWYDECYDTDTLSSPYTTCWTRWEQYCLEAITPQWIDGYQRTFHHWAHLNFLDEPVEISYDPFWIISVQLFEDYHKYVAYFSGGYSAQVVSPDGWEIWHVGEQRNITWNVSIGADSTTIVYIYLDRNGGNDGYPEYLGARVAKWGNSFSWTVTAPYSTHCRVKVVAEDIADNSAWDVSNYDFSISETGNNNPEIDGHIQCKYPESQCQDCIHYGETVTIEIPAHDPDGDSMYYQWFCVQGHFAENGQSTITTAENFVTYVAPTKGKAESPALRSEPSGSKTNGGGGEELLFDDFISVGVTDIRGGQIFAFGWPELHDQEYTCICGDANDDLIIELGDVLYLISYLYKGGLPPEDPIERGDANNDCQINLGDLTYLIAYFYRGGYCPECCWFPPEQ